MRVSKTIKIGVLFIGVLAIPFALRKAPAQQSTSDPDLAAALYQADRLQKTGHLQEAYDYLLTLPKDQSPEWAIQIGERQALLAGSLKKDPAADQANQTLQDLIAKYPDDPHIYLAQWRQAQGYLKGRGNVPRDVKKGQALLEALIEKHPQAKEVGLIIHDYATSFHREGNYAKAAEEYQKLLDEHEGELPPSWAPYTYFMLADSYYQQGKMDQATVAWKRLIQKYPENPWAKTAAYRLQ
jgi:outer membrane protein assembly factor BamD (BamD/ComL family)